jgi:hypothetical protein
VYTHLVLKLKCLTLGPPTPQNGGLKSISKSPILGDLGGDWEVTLPSTTFSLTCVYTLPLPRGGSICNGLKAHFWVLVRGVFDSFMMEFLPLSKGKARMGSARCITTL